MAKYIDREALVEWLKHIPLIDLSDGRGLCRVIMEDNFKKAIKKMPKGIIADVAPVRHGEWILGHVEPGYFTPGGNSPWICSKCKQVVSWSLARPEYNYCPNCGAKMDG